MFVARKTPSTYDAVRLSVATTRRKIFTLYWSSRSSPHIELSDQNKMYDPTPLFDALPSCRVGNRLTWPGFVVEAQERLAVKLNSKQVPYLYPEKVAARTDRKVVFHDILERVDEVEVQRPEAWGFAPIERGCGPFPAWLHYLQAKGAVMDRIRRLYTRVILMRNRPHEDPVKAWGWRNWNGVAKSPRAVLVKLGFTGEVWIRRRICRRSDVVALSFFTTRLGTRDTYEVHDVTAPLALHLSQADPQVPYLRAVFLVERGDGVEWVILKPSVDGYTGDSAYDGSPARYLKSRLREVWPKGSIRWIRDDAPLHKEGDLQ